MINTNKRVEEITNRWKITDEIVYINNPPENYVLNETGTKIWRLINGYNTVEDIINKLIKEFNEIEDEATVRSYVIEFFEQAIENKLVELKEVSEEDW